MNSPVNLVNLVNHAHSLVCAGLALVTDTPQLVLVSVIDVVPSLSILMPYNRSKTQVFSEGLQTSVSPGNAIEKPMTILKFDQFPLDTSTVHRTYTASPSSALILQRLACQDAEAQHHCLVFMGEKEPPSMAATSPRDDMEGKSQGILQAIWVQTDRRGVAKQTELPITKTSSYAEEYVRGLLHRASAMGPKRRYPESLSAATPNLHAPGPQHRDLSLIPREAEFGNCKWSPLRRSPGECRPDPTR